MLQLASTLFNLWLLAFGLLVLAVSSNGYRNETTLTTSSTGSNCVTWMFGAKFDAPQGQSQADFINEKIKAMQQVIESCDTYRKSGFGVAKPGFSSDYDVVFLVTSDTWEITEGQASCMVDVLEQNQTYASLILNGIQQASEVAIPGGCDELHNSAVESGDLLQIGFYKFHNDTLLHKEPLMQRFSRYTENALNKVQPEADIGAIYGPTSFPEAFLKMWGQDVHYANVFSFGKPPLSFFESLMSFRAFVLSKCRRVPGLNLFVPRPDLLSVQHTVVLDYQDY